MVATSNSTSALTYPVTQLIEIACRRCGKFPGTLSSEDIIVASQELQLAISALVNEGVPLWTIDKQIYGMNLNQNLLVFDQDTIDIQNALYRYNNLPSGGTAFSSAGGTASNAFDQNLTTACTQSAPNGYISYNFTTPVTIVTVGILPNVTSTLNPIYEYSTDNVTWNTAIAGATAPTTFTLGTWSWLDIEAPQTAQYFRVRETSGGTLNLTEVVFGTAANEILLSRINKDDYQNLPYKNQIGRPLEYWFDRQIIPQAWFWPASQYSFNSIVVWRRRVIQNVGTFSQTIEFSSRAFDFVISTLSCRMAMILPGVDPLRYPVLKQLEAESKEKFWREERDNSPYYLAPGIGVYTGYSSSWGGGSYGGY